jgi:F0F1-type ATP synthase membrane subunit c/vacuolar-type H+-ATPase subunit K
MSQTGSYTTITRDDIKGKLGEIQGEAQDQVQGARNQLLAAGLLVGLVLLIAAFLLGRRGGRRSSAVIEVRRG